jgi:hypothetical protein
MKTYTLLCLALSACSSSTTTSTHAPDPAIVESITPEDVVWTQIVHAVAAGGVLTKSGGQSGLDDAGAVSVQQLAGGDGWLEVTVDETQAFRFVGLAPPHTATTGAAIDFSFRLQAGRADIYERGVYRADNTVVAGDVLRVVVAGGVVRYEKNGKSVFTSAAAPTYPLIASAALIDGGARVAGARLGTDKPAAPAPTAAAPP